MGRDQNIDELFRQGLKDAEHPVGDHVWKGIEKSLPSFDTPRSGIRQLISSKTAISVFTTAVIVSGIAIFNYQQNNKQQPQRRDAIVETERPATAGESELKANDEQPEPAISDNDNKNKMQAMQPGLSHRDLGSNSVLSDQNPSIPSTETINSNETESTSSQNNEVTISKLTHQKTVVQELIKNTAVEPSASIEASPTSGYAPLAISFSNFGYAKTIKWDFGDGSQSGELAPLHTYEKAGNYKVTLMASNSIGKVDVDTLTIRILGGSSISFIPNVFSPNQDGYNDLFFIRSEKIKSILVNIFDRAGHVIYNWDHVKGNWDGRTKTGEMAPEGTYYYVLNAVGYDGKKYEKKGVITLMR